jgi:hypothetical protein
MNQAWLKLALRKACWKVLVQRFLGSEKGPTYELDFEPVCMDDKGKQRHWPLPDVLADRCGFEFD